VAQIPARERPIPRECALPAGINAADDVFEWAARDPGHPAFSRKASGMWQSVTSEEFASQVTAVAAGLIAAGIRPGDRIALLSATCFEWVVCDFAIWAAGAVTVPVYETSSVGQIRWILSDSGAVAVFTGNAQLAAAVQGADVPSIAWHWQLDGGGLDELAVTGKDIPAGRVAERRHGATAATLATIVYTSGTTAQPKGCPLSHSNLVAEVRNVMSATGIAELVLNERSSILLFLPLSHIFARIVHLCAVHAGARAGYLGDAHELPAEFAAFRPTIVLGVPRVFEKLAAAARQKAAGERHQRLFRAAEATAISYSRAAEGARRGVLLRIRHRVFDPLVYARLRAALGGNIAYAVSGGAPLSMELGHFFRGAGITILEGWGLTETTSGVTLNLPAAQRIGSAGPPLPGCAVRIAPDGEVLVQGPSVFSGYWRDEAATSEAFEDGWFRAGDLGRLDDQEFLYITGRKKDLIVTATGKNVAPAVLEDRLREHPLIAECVVTGDRRPYIGVLITLDMAALTQWEKQHRKPPGAAPGLVRDDPDLRSAIQRGVDRANEAVSRAEAIKRFRILDATFTVGAELTPTQKVRRYYVLSKFADEVEALYSQPGP
jgi:long-chain acyl-CoA synthetase